ncbi:MAG: NAD-glutamate dehydrogenase domain-containing protein, partial [Acidobacteriota bacterium]
MSPALEDKQLLIDRFVEHTLELADDTQPSGLEAFVRHCCEDLTPEDLGHAEGEALPGAMLELLALGAQREVGKLRLRITNPEFGRDDRTVIQVVSDDMPFLVDSTIGELNRRDLTVHMAMHPQISARRDASGALVDIVRRGIEGEDIINESYMHFEVDRLTAPSVLVDLETALRRVLSDVEAAVEDWQPMRGVAERVLQQLEASSQTASDDAGEVLDFLRWVYDDHFTFLGYVEYQLVIEGDGEFLRPLPQTGLGLLRRLSLGERVVSDKPLTSEAMSSLHGEGLVRISKTNSKATVHRNVHMDLIAIKQFDDRGELSGEHRFLGLFTSMAYSIAVGEIPLVRRKVARVINRTRFPPVSHSAKALRHIVENYPRDELFQISEDDLYRFALRILGLQLRPRLALLVRRDGEGRFVSCMVYVPRELHSTHLRMTIQEILEREFSGQVSAFNTRMSDRPLAQLHFVVRTQPNAGEVNVAAIEAELSEAARSWSDRLKQELGGASGQETGLQTWRRYGKAFPSSYQEQCTAEEAAQDIPIIDQVLEHGKLGMRLYRRQGAVISRFHLRTFEWALPAPLSSLMPMLENMGLMVNSEMPFEVRPDGAANPVWVRDFELVADDVDVDPEDAQVRFEDAFSRVWTGEIENDGFNRLVLRAGLSWRQVVVLRTYYRYLRQIGFNYSQLYVAQTLAKHPEIARLLIELFETVFDPRQPDDAGEGESRLSPDGTPVDHEVVQRIHRALDGVSSLDEDRILWRFLNLMQSTLRTNYFQTQDDGTPKPYLSLKLYGQRVRDLPPPRPMYEIFVCSPQVEAVHLRGGPVARGGIRWSDRREDFRTEILGLVKSQMVKNAVIVPVGAKGGFIVKQPPPLEDREEVLEEGIRCYQTMITAMLELTDNRQGDAVIPPRDVVRLDGDDPYLVVAADKGTASFSDIANRISQAHDFWLGDAFASGGSVGYDHKKMGITARGAWESVKRHFRELGRDIQRQPFTAAGVGDMGGDVFGNGMLLSEHTRLVAAFNHLHIFLDPDPDPAVSYAERRRLFEWTETSIAIVFRSMKSTFSRTGMRSVRPPL